MSAIVRLLNGEAELALLRTQFDGFLGIHVHGGGVLQLFPLSVDLDVFSRHGIVVECSLAAFIQIPPHKYIFALLKCGGIGRNVVFVLLRIQICVVGNQYGFCVAVLVVEREIVGDSCVVEKHVVGFLVERSVEIRDWLVFITVRRKSHKTGLGLLIDFVRVVAGIITPFQIIFYSVVFTYG